MMAQFVVEIDLEGAAFEDSGEVSRMLRALADRVEVQVIEIGGITRTVHNAGSAVRGDEDGWALHDINGQRVGDAWIEGTGV